MKLRPDIEQLRKFYDSPLGIVFCRILREEIRKIWPDVTGDTIGGIGFATPYLQSFLPKAKKTIAIMPGEQGVIPWPAQEEAKNLSLAALENQLPLADNCLDKIIAVHSLEYATNTKIYLRELWRVLAANGKLLIIVPNRTGFWTHSSKTPFGSGQPLFRMQIESLLEQNMFGNLRASHAIFTPPINSAIILNSANFIEKCGKFLPSLGGAILVSAEKQIHGLMPKGKLQKVRRFVQVVRV